RAAIGLFAGLCVLAAGAIDFRRQPLPHRRPGVIARPTQVFRGFEGPFLGATAKSGPPDPCMDADRLVEIDMHIVLAAPAMMLARIDPESTCSQRFVPLVENSPGSDSRP